MPQSHPVPRDRKAAAMITGFLLWETGLRGLNSWRYWEEKEGSVRLVHPSTFYSCSENSLGGAGASKK